MKNRIGFLTVLEAGRSKIMQLVTTVPLGQEAIGCCTYEMTAFLPSGDKLYPFQTFV